MITPLYKAGEVVYKVVHLGKGYNEVHTVTQQEQAQIDHLKVQKQIAALLLSQDWQTYLSHYNVGGKHGTPATHPEAVQLTFDKACADTGNPNFRGDPSQYAFPLPIYKHINMFQVDRNQIEGYIDLRTDAPTTDGGWSIESGGLVFTNEDNYWSAGAKMLGGTLKKLFSFI